MKLSQPFFVRMRELGYVEGRDFDVTWKIDETTKDELLPAMAQELLTLQVDVIVAEAANAQIAVHQATTTTPVVFILSVDPVASGFVVSTGHPGGNMTGLSTGSIPASEKRVEYLKVAAPGIKRLAIIWNGGLPSHITTLVPATDRAARALGIETKAFAVRDLAELDLTLDAIARERFDALILLPALSVLKERYERVPDFANPRGIVQAYADSEVVQAGGFMHFNSNREVQYRRTADFVDKILGGARPADMPVEEPTKFDLTLNLKAAEKLGLRLSPSLLASATEVIK